MKLKSPSRTVSVSLVVKLLRIFSKLSVKVETFEYGGL